jgi:phospholipid/cholesterol/gamma-HCH transport system substrate-binding protein
METRANHIWVGVVTLVLLGLAAGFALWLAHLSRHERKPYDIFFRQSVDGLAKGTPVNYKGVPAGQITEIELSPDDPSVVRVRINIDREVPILQGTTATIQGSFTGVSNIQLAGGKTGQPAITAPGPNGVPVIPTSCRALAICCPAHRNCSNASGR